MKNQNRIPWNKGLKGAQTAWNKGKNATPEQRLKLSLAHKGQRAWNKGVSPSAEVRKKISEKLKGRKIPQAVIDKIALSNIGRIPWNKGKKLSQEHINKFKGRKVWNKGIPMLPQTKQAIISANWKGGRINHQGYIRVRCEGHPKASSHGHYVLEHTLVMEKHLGRYLEDHEIVHHINGIRNDNRVENLVVLTRSEHTKHHHDLNRNK
jgi:hypothetical protein